MVHVLSEADLKSRTLRVIITGLVAGIVGGALAWWAIDAMTGNNHSMAGMDHMTAEDYSAQLPDMMGVESVKDLETYSSDGFISELAPTREGGVAAFALTATPIRLDPGVEKSFTAWGYEGSVPGPTIRVTEGEKVRITLTNNLPKATTLHLHGMHVPWEMDGVPGINQKAIKSGDSFTYEFTADPVGTHFYHTHGSGHGDESQQLDMGLAGPLIVEPRSFKAGPDIDRILVFDEWQHTGGMNAAMAHAHGGGASAGMMMPGHYGTFTINGATWPNVAPIDVKKGDRVRLRLINAGTTALHPVHIHGHTYTVVALDGAPVPATAQTRGNTLSLAAGQTADVEFVADNPGVWMIHCHDLHHADGGMMMLLRYAGYEPVEEMKELHSDGDGHMHGDSGMVPPEDHGEHMNHNG